MIESLHPLAIAAAVACVPVAAVALSAGADYLAHRHHEHHPPITPPAEGERTGQLSSGAGSARALSTPSQLPAATRKT